MRTNPMSDDPQNDLKPEIRQLPQAMNCLSEACDAAVHCRDLRRSVHSDAGEAYSERASAWLPMETCSSDQSSNSIDSQERSGSCRSEKQLPRRRLFSAKHPLSHEEDLKLVLHHSLKSLQFDPAERKTLEDQGCRAAVEIHFAYYSRPILRVILGLSNAKLLPTVEAQDFLLVFCRCCLVSLHGAYLAELDEREGRREKPELNERFNLTLQWFHSLMRHLNIGIAELQNGQAAEAEDALERASIVAGICLAEMLALNRRDPSLNRIYRIGAICGLGICILTDFEAKPFRHNCYSTYCHFAAFNHCSMRKVLKSDQGPLEIKPQEKSVWICMCGLSKNQPFCDGSHKKTRDEESGKTYEYDEEGHRQEVG